MILTGIIHGLVGFAIYFAATLLLLRISRAEPAAVVVAAAGLVPLATLAIFFGIGQRVNIWVFGTSYSFFTLCFLMAFGAIYKSVSLRILLYLVKEPGRTDSYDNVLVRFIAGDSFQDRLAVIQEKSLAVKSGDVFVLTGRGRNLAQAVLWLQNRFGITRSG